MEHFLKIQFPESWIQCNMQIWQCRSKIRIKAAAFQNHTPFNLIFTSVTGILFSVIYISSSVLTLLQKWAWVLHTSIETVLGWHPQSSPSPSSHLEQGHHGTQRDRQQSVHLSAGSLLGWSRHHLPRLPALGHTPSQGKFFPAATCGHSPCSVIYLPDQCLHQSSS